MRFVSISFVNQFLEAGPTPWNLQELCNETFPKNILTERWKFVRPNDSNLVDQAQKLVHGHWQCPNDRNLVDRTQRTCVRALAVPKRQESC